MKPLNDRIIVKPIPRLVSTLYIQTAEVETIGHIVAVSDESTNMGLAVGDKIYFGTLAKEYEDEYLKYQEFKDNDERLLVMSWKDVLFVEEQENG